MDRVYRSYVDVSVEYYSRSKLWNAVEMKRIRTHSLLAIKTSYYVNTISK